MNPTIKKILKIVLPILLGVFLVWYSFSDVPLDIILKHWESADKSWVILGMFLGLLSHLSRAYRWRFQLEPMGYHIKLPNSIMAVFSAYLINYTVPRAGEVARASILTTYEGVPFEKGFGTIVSERVADLITMSGIILVTLFLQFDFISSFLIESFHPKIIFIGVAALVMLFLIFIFYVRKSTSKVAVKIKTFVLGLAEGVLSIFKMKKKWPFIFHTFFIWFMYVMMFYVTTYALKDLEGIPIGAVLIGFVSASFSIAATNGGFGFYPIAVFAAFSIFGITKDISYAFGWIMWASQTLMLVVLGGISLLFLPVYNNKDQ